MDGIINVYKEIGFTSHDVVAVLRGVLRQKKIGHTGTLDPDAEGVLPVCLGRATKVCDMLTDWDKTYETVLLLGRTTDTQDISGEILSECEPDQLAQLTEQNVREVCRSFTGDLLQIPPMYSAKKVQGKKLYDLAREGIVIERKPCQIHVSELEILDVALPRVRMRITCSKGTYIRTICHDIGEALGTGGCMEQLLRTRVGHYCIEQSIRLDEIKALVNRGDTIPVTSLDDVFRRYRAIEVPEELTVKLYNGAPIPVDPMWNAGKGETLRLYDYQGIFIGLYTTEGRLLKLKKMFFNINDR